MRGRGRDLEIEERDRCDCDLLWVGEEEVIGEKQKQIIHSLLPSARETLWGMLVCVFARVSEYVCVCVRV